MVLVCFLLDLSSISPRVLGDLKQSLLQLANFYAISCHSRKQSDHLRDRISLCYLLKHRVSSSDELKIAYNPRGDFSLRDFHHAVNNLPSDAFSPEINNSMSLSCFDAKLSSLLSNEALYSWGSRDVMRKVIVLSSYVHKMFDSSMKKILGDAADKCVSVEFILLEQISSHLHDTREKISDFISCISDLDNCSFQSILPDVKVLNGLVKRWLQDLQDDIEEPLQAHFIFKDNLKGSVKQISCTLLPAINHVPDGFDLCQTCRCHGVPLCNIVKTKAGCSTCSITGTDLGTIDIIESSVKVGENTILFMPSFHNSLQLQKMSRTVNFHIMERTNLGSLSEGVVFGDSYIATPSATHEMEATSDEMDQPELNTQLFHGLCHALHALDQGLICFSDCNAQTMSKAELQCYYLLQPSETGPMLLRRLAGSEEVMPTNCVSKVVEFSVPKEIEISIQTSLLKLDSRDYNPIMHERGFHRKLNLLVKESLQFGSVAPISSEATTDPEHVPWKAVVLEESAPELDEKAEETTSSIAEEWELLVVNEAPKKYCPCCSSKSKVDETVVSSSPDINKQLDVKTSTPIADETTSSSIAEEWELLVVNEVPKKYSPSCSSKSKVDESVVSSSPVINKQLDVKTSRILERLEIPRQLKSKILSPRSSISDACFPMKKPLIPFHSSQTGAEGCTRTTPTQLIKPEFRRLKRKLS